MITEYIYNKIKKQTGRILLHRVGRRGGAGGCLRVSEGGERLAQRALPHVPDAELAVATARDERLGAGQVDE